MIPSLTILLTKRRLQYFWFFDMNFYKSVTTQQYNLVLWAKEGVVDGLQGSLYIAVILFPDIKFPRIIQVN